MKEILFKKDNNLFQSSDWLKFQKEYGRQTVNLGEFSGLISGLPLNKRFVWLQKGPERVSSSNFQVSNLPKGTIFVRLEPESITDVQVKKMKLRKVTAGSLLSGQKSPKATRILDISGSEEEILAQMKPKTRYNIKLASRKGVTVERLDDVDVLYDLLQKTAKRDKGYAPHEKAYYEKMIKNLAEKDLVHAFVAKYQGESLAAILVSFYGEVATYLHGGFNESQRNLMAPYLCQWEAIRAARDHGCRFYDFWGVAENDDPHDSWAGITRFKEGFGGERVIFPGAYDLVVSPLWYRIFSIMAKIKHIIR